MPATRKIVVHRKKTVTHKKPMRPMPKMLPAATTTAIVNKVLVKNGIRPGTPMHKKVFAPLKSFAVKHQKALIRARVVATHAAAAAAGAALAHTYKNKNGASKGTGFGRIKAATYNRLPYFLDPKKQGLFGPMTKSGKGAQNTRSMWQRFKNARARK